MRRLVYGLCSLLMLMGLFYFYKRPPVPVTESNNVKEKTKKQVVSKSPIVSKDAFQQASRIPVQEEKPPKPINLEGLENPPTIEEFFDQYGEGQWIVMKNELGQVTGVVPKDGGHISTTQYGGNVLAWAKQVAPLFGARAEQLKSASVGTQTDFQMVYHIQQMVGEYEVYNGGLQVAVRNDDRSIFNLNNSLRQIDTSDLTMKHNRDEARDILMREFSSANVTFLQGDRSNPLKPQFYAENEDSNKHELAWIFDIGIRSVIEGRGEVYTEKRVLIGSVSGKPLEAPTTLVR